MASDPNVETELGTSLYGVIDKDRVYGLNLAVPEDARQVIKPWEEREDVSRFVLSGVDDQVILHIPFTQIVRVKSILLKLDRGTAAPRHLRIYINNPTIIDFTDAETARAHLSTQLRVHEPGVVEYPLRVAALAFTSVTSLSLFFSDSEGGQVSRIYYVGFKGDVRAVSRDVSSNIKVPAPTAADAPLVDKAVEKTATTAR